MAEITLPHSHDELNGWFPDQRPAPPAGTFELGLVLAGAVSAGAYTAGVLDFLYEALDAWYLAKAREAHLPPAQRTVPHHEVVIRILTGASAGGMNGAISAAALRHRYPHPQGPGKAPDEGDFGTENPFYLAWVREIDIRPLLATDDLGRGLSSILNSGKLLDIVKSVIELRGRPLDDPAMRGWIANPLTVLLTVTNLRGVPYEIMFRGEDRLRHEMSLHRDHVTFAVPGLSPRPRETPVPAPDHVALPQTVSFADPVWRELGISALATGAFPLALEARKLSRDPGHYLYRNLSRADGELLVDCPSWQGGRPPQPYEFLCVDGGAMNNEPLDLARSALAGLNGHNPRKGEEANRAVIMIDPFADPGQLGPAAPVPLTTLAGATLRSMINQARFTLRDRALIQNQDVYSRYMIAPRRSDDVRGARSLASGGLGAFLGFLSEGYRHHDFMLGRRNCQRFLETQLALPEGNAPIAERWPAGARRDLVHETLKADRHLPLIPLLGKCRIKEELPPWPAGHFRRDQRFTRLVHGRVDAVIDELRRTFVVGNARGLERFVRNMFGTILFGPALVIIRRNIKKSVLESIDEAVAEVDRPQ